MISEMNNMFVKQKTYYQFSYIMNDSDEEECTQIINAFNPQTPNKGNLYLSGVGVLQNSQLIDQYAIGCVLTIIDYYNYHCFQIESKLKNHGVSHHKWLDIDDTEEMSIYPYLLHAHEYIGEMLDKTNVLVHCRKGKSRSASLVIAFMMKEYGLGFVQAKKFIKEKRGIVRPNQGFQNDLLRFEKQLQNDQQ